MNLLLSTGFILPILRQLAHTIESVITCAGDFERYLNAISPAQVYSATIENSLATTSDAFQNGSVYNVSALLMAGLATAVDALMAVKEFVYEKREIALEQIPGDSGSRLARARKTPPENFA